MSKNEQFDGEFTESDPNNGSAKQPISKQQGLGKVFLIGLCAGVLGGGVAVGGYTLYQNNSTQLASNSQGTTATIINPRPPIWIKSRIISWPRKFQWV